MSFAAAFREVAIPGLAQQCRFHGLLVALGSEGLSQAHGAVMATACQFGASKLPGDVLHDLEAWIDATLAKAVDSYEPLAAEASARADRVASAIADHEQAFLESLNAEAECLTA